MKHARQTFELDGLCLITNEVFEDGRGFFTERFKTSEFADLGEVFIQDNFSRSHCHVVRGLHYQIEPRQGKLVTCLRGEIFDVVVDIRSHSKTFGQSVNVRLSGNRPQWFWIPTGFAHGFAVLSAEGADILYKVTSNYSPEGERGLIWNDVDLKIPWPLENPLLSLKDQALPSFQQLCRQQVGLLE